MNTSEALAAITYIEDLFPKWEITDSIRQLWIRQLGYVQHHPGQVRHAVDQHRIASKYHDPNWVAIRGVLSNIQPSCEQAASAPATPSDGSPQWCEGFDALRARTRRWITAATPEIIAAITERAAKRIESESPAYADRLRNPHNADGLGGCAVAAIEGQLVIERGVA